ncbi:hypothetical protein ACQ4PT_053205 [Festuca glaucescens]
MESVASVTLSVGSTTAIGVEDDANNFSVGANQLIGSHGETYHMPERTSSLPLCGSTYDPECDDNLQPVIGMRFDTWEDGMAFYKAYAHEVGFSVRTWTTHKDDDGVPVWKRFVCSRQGWREVSQGAQDSERTKPKRKFKLSRCGCEAMIGFKRKDDGKYEDNTWLQEKYEARESWIPAYFMEISLGGVLRTTPRSESENAFFRHFANQNLALIEFWVRFETALEEQRQKELQEDNASLHTLPLLETCWTIESHGREVYTHEIFAEFQQQVVAARDHCHAKSMVQIGEVQTTTISSNSGKVRVVTFNTTTKATHCSCRMFESMGIICCHIIVVLKNGGYNEIPSQNVLHRWTKMAAWQLAYDANGHELEGSSTCLSPTMQKLYSETRSNFSSALHASKHCEEKMRYLHKAIGDAFVQLGQIDLVSEQSKVQEFESFVGTSFPSVINIHPPDVAKTKGCGKRLKKVQNNP